MTGYETVQGSARAGSDGAFDRRGRARGADPALADAAGLGRANRENLRARAAILRAKAEWEEKGESDEFLLAPGVQLERGRGLAGESRRCAVDDIRDYVGRSIAKDERRARRRAGS